MVRRIVKWLFWTLFLLLLSSLALVIFYRWVPVPITATMILDENSINKDWEPLERIDRDMVRAVIAAEDGKFCQHKGFDWEAIEDAMVANARGGRIRGGSTVSQQTAKNVFLWQDGGYFRKGLEAYFTFLIEKIWGKRRIMEVYLNVAETGIGTYGVAAGSERYFGHGADTLSRSEAARIAAVLPQPKKRPAINPGGFTARYGNIIAGRMGGADDSCVYPTGDAPATSPAEAPREQAPRAPQAPQAEPQQPSEEVPVQLEPVPLPAPDDAPAEPTEEPPPPPEAQPAAE